MLELTPEQAKAVERQRVVQLVDPATQEVFVLIRKEVYDLTRSIVGGNKGQVWDDKDDGLIQKRA